MLGFQEVATQVRNGVPLILFAGQCPVELAPLPQIRRCFEINTLGQVITLQAMLPLVRRAKGRVINIASVNGFFATWGNSPYAISKFGVEAMTESLRYEMAPFGVHVAVIEPGGVRTAMWDTTALDNRLWELMRLRPAAADYGERIEPDLVAAKAMQEQLDDPSVVAAAVGDALTSPTPQHRYSIAYKAGTLRLLRMLPDVLFYKIVASIIPPGTLLPDFEAE